MHGHKVMKKAVGGIIPVNAPSVPVTRLATPAQRVAAVLSAQRRASAPLKKGGRAKKKD